jgi:4a-hydroxytetrahydrobiopterin dehydratase
MRRWRRQILSLIRLPEMAPRPSAFSADELRLQVQALPSWELVGEKLQRSFTFADFADAFAFMTRVASVAEELDHHPDWSNSWNRVEISIVSHDAGGITQLCVDFARRVDGLV